MTGLERRYRLLLRVLPAWYRAVWEQDMVSTFLAGVEDEVAGDEQADLVAEFGWPERAEVVSVLALALRLRLGGAPDYAGSRAWGAAARRVALATLLIQAVFSVRGVVVALWLSGTFPVLPSLGPDLAYVPSFGEWVLLIAGLVWLAAYLALVCGHPHAAAGLAMLGLTQYALLRIGLELINDVPVELAAAAAVSVVVFALLLLGGLTAFRGDAPLPRRRPWLTALGVGLVLGPSLPVLAFRISPDALIAVLVDDDVLYCLLVVIAGTAYLARRAVRPGRGPAWPLALAVLAAAALLLRLTSLWAVTHNVAEGGRLVPPTAGMAQAGVALAAATALGILGARDLQRLPATPTGRRIPP